MTITKSSMIKIYSNISLFDRQIIRKVMRVINTTALLFGCVASITLFSSPLMKKWKSHNETVTSETERKVNFLRKPKDLPAHLRALQLEDWIQIGGTIQGQIFENSGRKVHISADGMTLAIASHGAKCQFNQGQKCGLIRVFTFCSLASQWLQIGDDILGEEPYDQFGISLALSGDGMTVAAGASMSDIYALNAGSVKAYRLSEGQWVQVGDTFYGGSDLEYFGSSVSLSEDGSVLAIGGLATDNNGLENTGCAVTFRLVGNAWSQVGSVIYGQTEHENLGRAVVLSANGEVLAIASSSNSFAGDNEGMVKVFGLVEVDSVEEWSQIGADIASDVDGDYIGPSIDLSEDGTIVAIGAFFNNQNSDYFGTVKVFTHCPNVRNWVQIGNDILGQNENDYFGRSVSLSADGLTLAVGAFSSDETGGEFSGSAGLYRFTPDNTTMVSDWELIGSVLHGENAHDYFGKSVSLSSDGKRLAVGAYLNDGSSTSERSSGNVRVFALH